MGNVVRSFACLNAECGLEFDSWDAAPYCTACRCAKVRWIPKGGNIISASTHHADRTLRSVAERFNLTDLRSAREGESAAPSLPTPRAIPGAPPLVLPGGIKVPRTMTASSSFAAMPQKIPLTRPLDGKALRRGPVGVPTSVQSNHVDKRKLVL